MPPCTLIEQNGKTKKSVYSVWRDLAHREAERCLQTHTHTLIEMRTDVNYTPAQVNRLRFQVVI